MPLSHGELLLLLPPAVLGMRALLSSLRRELKSLGSTSKARQMKAYMKSEMAFHGVPAPAVRAITKTVFADCSLSQDEWEETVLYLWRRARFREERYAVQYFCGEKRWTAYQQPRAMRVYEEMIDSGAWWDHVDNLAVRVGEILRAYPVEMKPLMRAWSEGPSLWRRRTSIICQLRFKMNTDLELLYSCIEASMDSSEFFLQKAIGWSLREYAWSNPDEVKRFVEANRDRLSPLSRREALKHL